MSMQGTLRLTESAEREGLAFDRRDRDRSSLDSQVTAVQHSRSAARCQCNRICSLRVLNISDSGLGAVAQEPIEVNTSIAIFFPPHGPERGIDLYGRVVRCIRRDDVHEVGVQFDDKSAA